MVVFVFGVGVAACGASWLRFESDFVKNFRPESEVRRGYHFIERYLSPLGSVEVIVRRADGGSIATAANLATARALGDEIVGRFAMVRKALTLADPLTLVGEGLPESDLGVGSRLAMFRGLETGKGILRNFINDAGDALRINLRCVEGFDVDAKLRACEEIESLAVARFGPGYNVEVTGLYHFYAKLVSNLLRDQYQSLGLTVAAITGIVWIVLRSVKLTVIVIAVNIAPVVICLGAMGWMSIPVNMTTAMVLSVTLGIAVDGSLHYIWRLRREYAFCGDLDEAIRRSHAGVGRACVFTTVVITGGFSILLFSRFLPTAYFGGLVGFTMLAALAAALVLLPSLIALVRPLKAIEKQ